MKAKISIFCVNKQNVKPIIMYYKLSLKFNHIMSSQCDQLSPLHLTWGDR